jgi:3-methyladenine DNA glycosylase AlkD
MDLATAMRRLEAAGTEQNRKVYPRHGIGPPLFGVSYAELGKLRKETGVADGLARELWATGNHDARILATMVADPAALSARDADAWLRDVDNYSGGSSRARPRRPRAHGYGATGRGSGRPAPAGS